MLWEALIKPVCSPANVEVAELAVNWFDKVVEPVTERLAPAVRLFPALMFCVVVMKPVLVMPDDVVVPSRLDEPDTLRLPEESR